MYVEIYNKYKAFNRKCRVSVNGMLYYLSASRSGFYSWLNRKPSNQQLRKEAVQDKIREIHAKSFNLYGASKITEELHKANELISERILGKYIWSKSIITFTCKTTNNLKILFFFAQNAYIYSICFNHISI